MLSAATTEEWKRSKTSGRSSSGKLPSFAAYKKKDAEKTGGGPPSSIAEEVSKEWKTMILSIIPPEQLEDGMDFEDDEFFSIRNDDYEDFHSARNSPVAEVNSKSAPMDSLDSNPPGEDRSSSGGETSSKELELIGELTDQLKSVSDAFKVITSESEQSSLEPESSTSMGSSLPPRQKLMREKQELQRHNEAMKREYEMKIEELRENLRKQESLDSPRGEERTSSSSMSINTSKLKELRRDVVDLKKKLEDEEEKNRALEEDLEDCKHDKKRQGDKAKKAEERVKELKKKVEELDDKLCHKDELLDELESSSSLKASPQKLETLMREKEDLEKRNEAMQREYETQIEELREDLRKQELQCQTLATQRGDEDSPDEKWEEKMAELSKSKRVLERKVKELQREKENLEQDKTELEIDNKELEDQIKKKDERYEKMMKRRRETSTESLFGGSLEDENKELTNRVTELKRENVDVSARLTEAQKQLSVKIQELEEMRLKVNSQASEGNDEEIEKLKNERLDLEKHNRLLLQELEDFKADLELERTKQEAPAQTLQVTIDTMRKSIEESNQKHEDERQKQNAALVAAEEELKELREKVEQLNTQIAVKQELESTLRDDMNRLREDVEKEKEQLKEDHKVDLEKLSKQQPSRIQDIKVTFAKQRSIEAKDIDKEFSCEIQKQLYTSVKSLVESEQLDDVAGIADVRGNLDTLWQDLKEFVEFIKAQEMELKYRRFQMEQAGPTSKLSKVQEKANECITELVGQVCYLSDRLQELTTPENPYKQPVPQYNGSLNYVGEPCVSRGKTI